MTIRRTTNWNYLIKITNKQINELEQLKTGETYETELKGFKCYIERVETESESNLQINGSFYFFNFFSPSVVVANPQTVKQFLNSSYFKNKYKCWYYANRLYNQYGEEIDGDKYELYDDEKYNDLIKVTINM